MLQYLKNEANLTHTENGAVTYLSTQSECLDLFATIGALRRESDEEITNRFLRAYVIASCFFFPNKSVAVGRDEP